MPRRLWLISTSAWLTLASALGLFALVVNGFLFWLVGWVSGLLGFGLTIDNFWWAIGGAILMGLFSAILNGIFRTGKKRDDLQAVIALLKGEDFGIALQFVNYR